MNFETMHRQRKWILLSAVVGIIGIFLKWSKDATDGVHFFPASNGFSDFGIAVFIAFVIAAGISLMGDQTKTLNPTNWMITLIVGGIALLIMLIKFFQSTSYLSLIGFGFWLTDIAAISLLYYAYTYRTTGATIQGGFDSLKGTIAEKTASPTTTPTATPTATPTNVTTTTTAAPNVVPPAADPNKPVA